MKAGWAVVCASLLLGLSGCAVDYATMPASDFAKQVRLTGVKFDKSYKYTGLRLPSSTPRQGAPSEAQGAWLYAEQSKSTQQTRYYVVADITYQADSYRRYTRVSFADAESAMGKRLRTEQMPCRVARCPRLEVFRFAVSEQRLRRNEDLEFRLEAGDGSQNVFVLPVNYVDGFLLATP